MKILLSIAALLLALSCRGQNFYQFNRYTTNFDTTQINGINLTNISGTNLVLGTVNSNKFDAPTLALFGAIGAPTITQTNFVSGFIYTNTSGRPQMVLAGVALTVAAISGAAEMSFYVDPVGALNFTRTNRITLGTVVGTVVDTYVFQLTGIVPASGSYVITNTSRGAGNSGQMDDLFTKGILVTY